MAKYKQDVIAELRVLGKSAALTALHPLFNAAADEIQRCHERLEIDHCFLHVRNVKKLSRRENPYQERGAFPDAIDCRDAKIALLENDLSEGR